MHGSEEESFSAFDIGETGLPHYKIYGRTGELLKTFFIDEDGNPINQEDLESTLKEALQE